MRECTQGKAVWGDYKTPPQLELLVCFHGEVESALKKWPHPEIKGGRHIARHGGDDGDDGDDGPLFPCGSFSWQWLNEFVVREGGLEW